MLDRVVSQFICRRLFETSDGSHVLDVVCCGRGQDPEKSLVDIMSALFSPSKKEEAWKVIGDISREIFRHYCEVVEAEDHDDDDDSINPPECLVHFLVRRVVAKGAELDEQAIIGDLFAFYFASYTNSYAVLAWVLWHTATDDQLRGK